MKVYDLFIMISLFLSVIACNNDDIDPLETSTWVLKEQYFDPGNGSGDFMDVDSDKSITFNVDSTVLVMGSICSMSTDDNESNIVRYDEGTFYPDCVGTWSVIVGYQVNGDELILSYPCIEPCREKYKRID